MREDRSKHAAPMPRGALDLAEREGFEPPVPLRVLLFSRQARSTTLAPLRMVAAEVLRLKMAAKDRIAPIQRKFRGHMWLHR